MERVFAQLFSKLKNVWVLDLFFYNNLIKMSLFNGAHQAVVQGSTVANIPTHTRHTCTPPHGCESCCLARRIILFVDCARLHTQAQQHAHLNMYTEA